MKDLNLKFIGTVLAVVLAVVAIGVLRMFGIVWAEIAFSIIMYTFIVSMILGTVWIIVTVMSERS